MDVWRFALYFGATMLALRTLLRLMERRRYIRTVERMTAELEADQALRRQQAAAALAAGASRVDIRAANS